MDLRPYQQDCLSSIEAKYKQGLNQQLVVLPTGAGKTVIFSELIKQKNLKTLVIAHRIELLEQAKDKLEKVAPDISAGIFCGDMKCHDKQVTIASIQSAVNALDLLKAENYQLLIIDEAHHSAAKSYKKLISFLGFNECHEEEEEPEISEIARPYLKVLEIDPSLASLQNIKKAHRKLAIKYHPDTNSIDPLCAEKFKRVQEAYEFFVKREDLLLQDSECKTLEENDPSKPVVTNRSKLMVGFTATPKRGDNAKLDHIYQEITYSISIRKLVNRGFLVKPEGLHVKLGIDLKKVRTQMGDFKKSSLKKVMLSDQAREIVVRTIQQFASDRRGIVFSVDIEHSEMLKKDMQEVGFSSASVHSKVSANARKQALKDFEEGKLQFLINPMILTEGFDCPRADCMINASPTKNRSLYIQKAGRVLRLHPEKENALLIDFGMTKKKHTLVTATDLMGDDIPMRTVSDRTELYPEEKEETSFNQDLKATKEAYNLFTGQSEKIISIDENRDVLNPFHWANEPRLASFKQKDFIRDLCKITGDIVENMESLGVNQAKKIIAYLRDKRDVMQMNESITKKQAWRLESIVKEKGISDLNREKIHQLNKYEAKTLIFNLLEKAQ